MKPYEFQVGHTKHLIPASSDEDAKVIAGLIGGKVLGVAADQPGFCVNCSLPLICPDCEDFEYCEPPADPRNNN